MKKKNESAHQDRSDDTVTAVQPEPYAGIKSQLRQLVSDAEASLTGSGNNQDSILESIEAASNLHIITEEDRLEYLQAFCQLCKLYMEKNPDGAEIKEVTELFNKFNGVLYHLYATDSLYYQSIQVLYEYVGSLSKPSEAGQAFVNAIQKTTSLPLGDASDDQRIRGVAVARIVAASTAFDWFLNPRVAETIEDPGEKEFARLLKYFETHPFDKDEIINTFERVDEIGKKYTGDVNLLSATLLRIYGIGMLLSPQSAPALESLEDRLITLTSQYTGQFIRDEANQTAIQPKQKNAEEIIAAFTALVSKDGTSLYAFDQVMAEIKKLPQETEEHIQIYMDCMLKICDIGIQYSPDENTSGPIRIAKENLQKTFATIDTPPKTYTAKELKSLLDQNLSELKQHLAEGENPGTAITRGMGNMISLITNMSEEAGEGDDMLKVFTDSMFKDFMAVVGNYVSENQKAIWKETMKTMGFVSEAVDHMHDNEVEAAISLKRFEEQNERYMNTALHLPVSNEAMSTFYVMQFLDLFPGLAIRFIDMDVDNNTDDKKEYERLKADLDDTLRLLSSAYTMEQFMQHQKISLRRMSIELSQFERRRFLMIASPVFPAANVVVDPNRVFFSGTGNLVKTIVNSCNTLGMVLSTRRSVSNQLDSRWAQIRESALAIFDYSGYDPVKADPGGLIHSKTYLESETLGAAGPVASVAYENGWAYALGKPVVIITKKNTPIPFDIDIEPVVLEDDEKDEERIIAGIQTALYGINRNTKGSCLAETMAYAHSMFEKSDDEKIASLLKSMNSGKDATRIRLTIETILDRTDDKNQMLITPSFPGGYPDHDVKKVFHVTGFREWSKPLENELKRICKLRGLQFNIGYDKINPEILPAIWKDITEASFIVADITNLNPNAVLELAMAQAIGRPVLILTQNAAVQNYFSPVLKTRTHQYDPVKSKAKLTALLEGYFDGKD